MEKFNDFRDLKVWQKSHALVLEIYKITKSFPREEKFGLVSQMRRAGISVAANISEGFRKRGRKDKVNFYNMAQGSLEEIRYYLILSNDLKYTYDTKIAWGLTDDIGKMLNGLISSINKTLVPNY